MHPWLSLYSLLRRVVHGILLEDHNEFFVQLRDRGPAISSDPMEAAAAEWHNGFQVLQETNYIINKETEYKVFGIESMAHFSDFKTIGLTTILLVPH